MTNLEASTMTVTQAAEAAPEATRPETVIDRWRAVKEHDATDHAAYAILRAAHAFTGKSDEELLQALIARLARAFTPDKDDGFKALKDSLYYLSRYNPSHALFSDEDAVIVKEWALVTHDELRTTSGIAAFTANAVAHPPPRPKKPFVR